MLKKIDFKFVCVLRSVYLQYGQFPFQLYVDEDDDDDDDEMKSEKVGHPYLKLLTDNQWHSCNVFASLKAFLKLKPLFPWVWLGDICFIV